MHRWILIIVMAVICVASCMEVASLLLERKARLAATENGAVRDFHRVTLEQLDKEIRSRLPVGSSRLSVENLLRSEGMRFRFDASMDAIQAVAPYLNGSGIFVNKSVTFTFYFDDAFKLKSIDTKVHRTGL